jgi:hypothetical protein
MLLQQIWLVANDIPEALQQHSAFLAWLKKIRKQALPLQSIFSTTLRTRLQPRPDQKIDQ